MKTILVIAIAIIAGFIAGNAVVYAFNHIPDDWLGVDEADRDHQRVVSMPWKYVMAASFMVAGIYLGMRDPVRAPGLFVALFIIVLVVVAMKKYNTVPRPLVWMLLITGIAIVPLDPPIKMHLIGAAIGAIVSVILIVIGYIAKRVTGRLLPSGISLLELFTVIGFLIGTV